MLLHIIQVKKKKNLIDKIYDVAIKINQEAKNKLNEILDLLILPEPKKVVVDWSCNTVERIIDDSLSEEQSAIKNFLDSRGIKYLVHFTDKSNYDSIKEHGILSQSEAYRRKVNIKVNDNNISSKQAYSYMKSDHNDYLSLSITKVNEDLIRAYRASGRMKNIVVFYIDARLLYEEMSKDRIYCNMNASKYEVLFSRDINGLEGMFAPVVSQIDFVTGEKTVFDRVKDKRKDNETTNPRAEILFEKRIDPKYFIEKVEEY